MTIFEDKPGKLVPDCLHSGFYWMMEVAAATGAIGGAKLRSNRH